MSEEPKGNYFVFRGVRFIHVTEGHAKNWICYQHPDGQWVTLYFIPNAEPKECVWTEDQDGNYDTGCGHKWIMNDLTGVNLCCCCGGSLTEKEYELPQDCNVCGRELMRDDEKAIGACAVCMNEVSNG